MKYQLLQPLLTERLCRQCAAYEAESLGRGGVSLVAEATGLSRTTLWLRIQAELDINAYRTDIRVSAQELATVRREGASFHGEWKDTIGPRERDRVVKLF